VEYVGEAKAIKPQQHGWRIGACKFFGIGCRTLKNESTQGGSNADGDQQDDAGTQVR